MPKKASGVEWIGRVPAHWDVARVKHVARLESGHTPSRSVPEHWLDSNDIPWVSLNDTKTLAQNDYISDTALFINKLGLQNSSAHVLPARVVVFTRDATIGKAAITTRPMAVSQHLIAWVCGSTILPEYLLRVFYAMEGYLERFTFGATIKTIGMRDVGTLVTPVPPLHEQKWISDFLDRKIASIDDLIAKQERLIDLLREKRNTAVEQALRTASGPTLKLSYLADVLPGYAFPSDGFLHADVGIRLLRGVNVSTEGVRWTETVRWDDSNLGRLQHYALRTGDIVFGMDRPWVTSGVRVASVSESDLPSLVLQRVLRLRATKRIRQEYLHLLLASRAFREYFEPELTGVSVPHISDEQVRSFRITLPSLEQQDEICRVARRLAQTEAPITCRMTQQVDKLREYRQALITAAVTGKVDVTKHEGA